MVCCIVGASLFTPTLLVLGIGGALMVIIQTYNIHSGRTMFYNINMIRTIHMTYINN